MSKPKKALTGRLLDAAVPYLGPEAAGSPPPKAVAKTLRKLAKQLLKQQGKIEKTAPAPAAEATAKQARKALAAELTASLQPYLGTDENAAASTPKPIAKTIKRLASALVKQRRKQAKQAAKAAPAVVVGSEAANLKKASGPAAANRPAARRAAAPKRPAAKPAVAPAAPSVGTAE